MGLNPSPTPVEERMTLMRSKGAVGRNEPISGCGLARDHTPQPEIEHFFPACREVTG